MVDSVWAPLFERHRHPYAAALIWASQIIRAKLPFMESVDWGVDNAPAHFPGVSERCTPTDSDDPSALPGVRAARGYGYEPAPEAPMWTFLPAVWPPSARAWIPDTRIRHTSISCTGEPPRVVPWSTADYFEMEADANELLTECGLPPRPGGRLWLLKPPPALPSLESTLTLLVRSANEHGMEAMATPAFVKRVQRDLPEIFETPATS